MIRIPHCRRCDARDAEGPDGWARFYSRWLFGPRVARDLCARCFSLEMWIKWRFLAALVGAVLAGYGAWNGEWSAVAVGLVAAGGWWWVSTIFIKARGGDDADAA